MDIYRYSKVDSKGFTFKFTVSVTQHGASIFNPQDRVAYKEMTVEQARVYTRNKVSEGYRLVRGQPATVLG